MEEFKIKSLDDFDSMFMSSKNTAAEAPAAPAAPAVEPVQAPVYNAPVQPAEPVYNPPVQPVAPAPAPKKESLIPEMETGPVEIDFFEIDGVPAGAAPAPAPQRPASNVYSAAPVSQNYGVDINSGYNAAPKAAQPPVSLYQAESMNNGGIQQFLYQPEKGYSDDNDYEEYEESGKGGALPMVGKVVSVVMLAITLLVFVIGCFVTIFLNNKDSKCGSICFATVAEDAVDGFGVKEGSLVVCKSVAIDGYNENDTIAVPTNVEGCKLYQVVEVKKEANLIVFADPSDNGGTQSRSPEEIYGLATFNLGGLGKVINFASNNSILVCILFLLLAALWCLCIILIEKSQENKAPEEDEEEDFSDNGGLSF